MLLLLTLGFFNIAVALDQDLSAQPQIVAQTERAFSARCALPFFGSGPAAAIMRVNLRSRKASPARKGT